MNYYLAREFIQSTQLIFLIILISASFALAVLSIVGNKHTGKALYLNVFLLAFGFALLAWFHYQIYQNIGIINPLNQADLGRLKVPLWIENEKLYFWAFLLGIFTLFVYRKNDNELFSKWLILCFTIFTVFMMLTSNPFKDPLPGLHEEINTYFNSLASSDPYYKMQIFQRFYGRATYFYNSDYMWIHPPLLFLSYAALIISFLGSIFMLFKKDSIFDKISYSYARVGYLALTFGMLVSYPWALEAWANEPWWWSPKINMSLMMWMFYTAYLHSRIHLHRRGMWNTTALLGIFCFLTLIMTYITTYLIPGVHSYG